MLLGYVARWSSSAPDPVRWPLLAVAGVVTLVMAVDDIVDLIWWQKLIVVVGAGVAFYSSGSASPPSTCRRPSDRARLLACRDRLWVAGCRCRSTSWTATRPAAWSRSSPGGDAGRDQPDRRSGRPPVGVVILSAALMGVPGFSSSTSPGQDLHGRHRQPLPGVILAAVTIVGIARSASALDPGSPDRARPAISDTPGRSCAVSRRSQPTTPDAPPSPPAAGPRHTDETASPSTSRPGCSAAWGSRSLASQDPGHRLRPLRAGVAAIFWRTTAVSSAAAEARAPVSRIPWEGGAPRHPGEPAPPGRPGLSRRWPDNGPMAFHDIRLWLESRTGL